MANRERGAHTVSAFLLLVCSLVVAPPALCSAVVQWQKASAVPSAPPAHEHTLLPTPNISNEHKSREIVLVAREARSLRAAEPAKSGISATAVVGAVGAVSVASTATIIVADASNC